MLEQVSEKYVELIIFIDITIFEFEPPEISIKFIYTLKYIFK
jgi:hypothetical protein